MDLMSGLDKFGLNSEDINDLYDEDKAGARRGRRCACFAHLAGRRGLAA